MVRYLERLAATSPRVTMERQGETWEGRALVYAIVTTPANHARLAAIRENAQRLGDPRRTTAAEAASIIGEGHPVIVWFGGSIHGFELSGSEGALKLLEHLATRDDAPTREALERTVVLIDPMLNPDGRDAFAHLNHESIGETPNPKPQDWANDFTRWQSIKFRTGHYYFDTNRDWFAHTQRETRARIPTLLAWRPQVVVDMHEMGSDVEFYFDPAGEPYGPYYPAYARRWHTRFGAAYAAAFDNAGFEYMTRERYNYFYPGYTTSYGSYTGGIGMLYEQGSSRGLALERPDASIRTLSDALEQQYTAAWAAVQLAAGEREALLREYYEGHVDAIEDGRSGAAGRRYLIAAEGDPSLVAELVNLLTRNGIEVDRLTESVRLSNVRDRTGQSIGQRAFSAGTFVVDAAQPRNRLTRALLEPSVPLPEGFLEYARSRVDRGENPRFYDITAWSLPLLFNVGAYSSADARSVQTERVTAGARVASTPVERAGYAYLFDGSQAAALSALYHLKARGHRASVTLKATRIGGRDVASGTVVVRIGQNDETVHDAVRELAARFGVGVRAVATGLSAEGFPALGSADVIPVKVPNIAMLAEDPIQGYSFGWAWYTLDRQYEIPTTVVRVRSVQTTDLSRFNVLIVPEASASALSGALGDEGVARLTRWVRDGGTLVTIGRATDFAREHLEQLALRSWYDNEDAEKAQRFDVPGAILRAELDPGIWMAAGYGSTELPVLVNSERIYLEPAEPPASARRIVARYGTDNLNLAGHAWPETLERLPGAVFAYDARIGRGRVVVFAEDVNFRAYWRGANRLFLNAVILGPSAP
jgi:hypothetical protein